MNHLSHAALRALLCALAVLAAAGVAEAQSGDGPAGASSSATDEGAVDGTVDDGTVDDGTVDDGTDADALDADALDSPAAEDAAPGPTPNADDPTPETASQEGTRGPSPIVPEPAATPGAAPSAEAADEEPHARPSNEFTFNNSFFSYTNAVTVNTFAPGAQLSYDPTWFMYASVTPRFYLTDTTFLWLNQSASIELTDTNDGTYNREPLLSDTILDLRQVLSWEGFVFQGQLRLAFPLSKASQAAQRIVQTGLGLTVARAFPELAGFTVAASFAYRRWWATSNVPMTGSPYPGNCFVVTPGGPPECQQASGQTSARDMLLAGLTLNVSPFSGFTVSASGFYFTTYGFELAPGSVPINGGGHTVEDESITHWRPYTYFSLAVAYDVLPWLNLQLGVQNSGFVAPLYNPDGSVRSPFTADTQVYLTTTIGLDGLYNEIVSGDEDDGLTPQERQRRRQGLARSGGSSAF
ncbi:MAG: hypothetical protein AB7S26_35130 [Sandaracinaceae bacterium]